MQATSGTPLVKHVSILLEKLMRTSSNRIVIGVAFLSVIFLCNGFSSAPETIEHALKRHNIEISKGSLIEALSNPDKEVRGLAAAELAELKMTDSLTDILRAAETELDPQTKINIAAAATWMDSPEGLNILKNICSNSGVSPLFRIEAARNVFFKHDHSCFSTLVDSVNSPDPDTRIQAISVASQISPKTHQEAPQILSMAIQALTDQDLRIRLQASEALRWMNDPASIVPLRTAIENEREQVVQSQMQSALDSITKRQAERPTPNQ